MFRIYIYSTLSNDQRYQLKNGQSVLIAGKANVANKQLVTPKGMATAISEDEFNLLQENIVFKAHFKNGFVAASHDKSDAEAFAARNLEGADKSAQDTPATAKKRNAGGAKVKDAEA
ncbi:hypothetical protein RAS12_13330 [Achromobacter seleniivolatilans]|uniref:Uncharacterized protein n=1 Tax=Achromobacter seleniivolatilans TaxID=3047478 RepID=A0ABY9M9E8_9BURK|nr:hypothetical protein [Achromobacter sp. R39]WMD23307.1 hypothetical protein RAS12_13330 [Achromobacter sp. R39]